MPPKNLDSRTRQPRQVTLHTDLELQSVIITPTSIVSSVVAVNSLADGTEVGRGPITSITDTPLSLSDLPQEVQDAVQVVKDYILAQIP